MVVAVGLACGRAPVISLLTLCCTEKRDLLRDHLHDFMPGSAFVLVVTVLNTALNSYEPLSAAGIYA